MNKLKVTFAVLFTFYCTFIFSQPGMIEADNGVLKLKLDLSRGGAICYVSLSRSDENLVNIFDEGRYIQQSYYAGESLNRQREGQSHTWSPWPWNPIQVGDAFGNRAEILDFAQTQDTLNVKCTPMLWDMNNKPAEAVMEQWTVLEGDMIKVTNRLTCLRHDTIYGDGVLRDQELPAVYPISKLSSLYFYKGEKPFTQDSLSSPEVVNLASTFWV